MLEVVDELPNRLHHLRLREVLLRKYTLKPGEEPINLIHRVPYRLLHYPKSFEPLHIYLLPRHIKFLIRLLSRSIASKVNHRIRFRVIPHSSSILLRLSIRRALLLLEPLSLHEIITYRRESQHLILPQFREKHLSPITQNTSQHTNLSALLRRHKVRLSEHKAESHSDFVERLRTRRCQIPPNITRRSQRLFLLQPMNPPVRQQPIRKSHIRKSRRRHLKILIIRHHQILHDSLRSPHDIHRISRLIRRHADLESLGKGRL